MTPREIIKLTIAIEGNDKFVNDPDDAGGKTKYGISQRQYPTEDIENLTLDRAVEIYERDYWNRLRLNSFYSKRIAWKVFDIEVNTGQGDEILQRALGMKPDGMVGEKTIAAANLHDIEKLMDKLIELQSKRYVSITTKKPLNLKYLSGWINRAFERGENIA